MSRKRQKKIPLKRNPGFHTNLYAQRNGFLVNPSSVCSHVFFMCAWPPRTYEMCVFIFVSKL